MSENASYGSTLQVRAVDSLASMMAQIPGWLLASFCLMLLEYYLQLRHFLQAGNVFNVAYLMNVKTDVKELPCLVDIQNQ